MTTHKAILVSAFAALLAGCAAPHYRWIKAGADADSFERDRQYCLGVVDRDFNPYDDYGSPFGSAPAEEALFRQRAAEEMFRRCMRGRGYRLVTVSPPDQR